MKTPYVITAAEAAREKACTTQAIYNALDRGDLNEVRMGGIRLILKDAAYEAYQVSVKILVSAMRRKCY